MSASRSRLLRLAAVVVIVLSTGDAFARKPDYAMPPTPAIAAPMAFKVVPAEPVDASQAGEKPRHGPAAFADPLYLDDGHRITYRQEYGGGGLAVGLLLGPLGAAANAKAIQSANERESAALHGKFPFTPEDLLGRVLAARPPVDGATVEPQLVPRIFVTRDADEQLIFWAMIDVTLDAWRGRYSALVPRRVPFGEVTQGLSADSLRDLESGLQGAYAAALDVMADDMSGRLAAFGTQRVKIEALSPRFPAMGKYEHALRTDAHVIVRLSAPGPIPASGVNGTGVLVVPTADAQFAR